MPTPKPDRRPPVDQIETRLLVVAEMLDRAVEEVRRVMARLKDASEITVPVTPPGSFDDPADQ